MLDEGHVQLLFFIYFNKSLLIQKHNGKIFKIFKKRIMFQSASDLTLDQRNHRPLFQRVIQTQKKTPTQYFLLLG